MNFNIGIIVAAVIIAIFAVYLYYNRKQITAPSGSTSVVISNSGISSSTTEGFGNLFPFMPEPNASARVTSMSGGYPVYGMLNHTKNNIDLVNSLDDATWKLVLGDDAPCDPNSCKLYAIKNKGQFQTHLANYKKWLDSLNPAALDKLSVIVTSMGLEYDNVGKNIFFSITIPDEKNTPKTQKYIVLPITSVNTPIEITKTLLVEGIVNGATNTAVVTNTTVVANSAVAANTAASAAPANTVLAQSAIPTSYVLYSTYMMLLMIFHKVLGKELIINYDDSWAPISATDYSAKLNTPVSSPIGTVSPQQMSLKSMVRV